MNNCPALMSAKASLLWANITQLTLLILYLSFANFCLITFDCTQPFSNSQFTSGKAKKRTSRSKSPFHSILYYITVFLVSFNYIENDGNRGRKKLVVRTVERSNGTFPTEIRSLFEKRIYLSRIAAQRGYVHNFQSKVFNSVKPSLRPKCCWMEPAG